MLKKFPTFLFCWSLFQEKKKPKTLSFPLFIFISLKQTSLSPSSSEKAPISPSEYSSPSSFPCLNEKPEGFRGPFGSENLRWGRDAKNR
ncbi:hypothetical protein ES288_A10G167700v1 [Gossypium darwinii]|nr:hypothetical protein ES288_A10G167700v1 [Gossypium darwinii]